MKIGVLVWELNIAGGTQRQALELACNLQRLGHEVVVYTYAYDYAKCYPELCKSLMIRSVRNDPMRKQLGSPADLWAELVKYVEFYFQVEQKELLQFLDDDLDVLNPHDYRCYVTAGLWKQATGKPAVWNMNDMPLYTLNVYRILKTIGYYARPKFRRYIKSFDSVVVLDEINKKQFERDFRRSAQVIRSGIDAKSFPFLPSVGGSTFRLLSIGIFLPHRRVEDSIRAIHILRQKGYDVCLDHVGSESIGRKYASQVYQLVRELRLNEHVKFHGSVSERALRDLYAASNAFIFPNAPQTWGLSVLEAMSCGLPVVLTTGSGVSEVLKDRVNALITQPRDPDALADAIELLIKNPSTVKQLTTEARRFVSEELSWEQYARSMARVFSDVTSKYARLQAAQDSGIVTMEHE